jgi:hypothetical protein
VDAHPVDYSGDKPSQVFSPTTLSQKALIDSFDAGAVEGRCVSIGGHGRGPS